MTVLSTPVPIRTARAAARTAALAAATPAPRGGAQWFGVERITEVAMFDPYFHLASRATGTCLKKPS
jgi:hypothetical protein